MFGFRGVGEGLGVVAVVVGLNAPANAGDERALYASLGEVTRSPIGWVEFCAENPGECRGGASQPRDIVMSQTAWRELLRGQRWGKENLKPLTHKDHLGVVRETAVPAAGFGGRRDYRLLKRPKMIAR